MIEPLVSPHGRYIRANIVARAREIHAAPGAAMGWGAAMAAAYGEAAVEMRAYRSAPPQASRALEDA